MREEQEHADPSKLDRLAAMRNRFATDLGARLEALRHLHALLLDPDGYDPGHLAELHRQAHSLAGTAGTFGLRAIGAAARRLEQALALYLAADQPPPAAALEGIGFHLAELDELLHAAPQPSAGLDRPQQPSRRILVVEDDRAQAEAIAVRLALDDYQVEVLTDLEAFRAACAPGREPPAAVIMDIIFPEGDVAGVEAIDELRRRTLGTLPVIFVSVRDDMQTRLAAQRAGATAYLVKPLDMGALITALGRATQRGGEVPYRVLLVDDDPVVLAVHADLLEQAGMRPEGVSDPLLALQAALRLRPDCLVIDLYMPGCSGMELAGVLRADPRFLEIPIVFVSSEQDVGRQLHAMDMGGDIFLTKPVEPRQLVNAIRVRSRRTRDLRRLNDSLRQSLHESVLQRQALDRHALVSITDGAGDITYANDRFCEVSGYSRSELIGRNHRLLKSGVHPLEFYAELWATILGGRIWQGEICNRRKDGQPYWVQSTIVPYLDEAGRPYQYIAIRTDITLHKEAEAVLREAKQTAEEASRAKTAFLASMSHELRTPLNGILGYAQMLEIEEGLPLASSQREYVQEILGAGRHLLALIEDLLDIARIEAGRLHLNLAEVALATVLSECSALVQPTLARYGVTLSLEADGCESYSVHADHTRLRQVLLNLLSNAAKYNKPQGRIEVECAVCDGERIRVSVRDTGIGIAAAQREQLFTPFKRLVDPDHFVEGTGIGLAISKKLVELMGGWIDFDSEPGVGSTFWIELPLIDTGDVAQAGAATGPAGETASDSEARQTLRNVLYVDDNPENRRLMETILRGRARLMTAENGQTGLELAASQPPDLILLDIMMPGLDGFQVFERLQAQAATRAIPVFAVSADAQYEDVQRALGMGFRDYFTKPLDVRKLLAAIDTVLAAKT